MKLLFTEQALSNLQDCLNFFPPEVNPEKVNEIRDRILKRTDKLLNNPHMGQPEEYLVHLKKGYRRIIEGHYKIIYRVEGNVIYITGVFDSR